MQNVSQKSVTAHTHLLCSLSLVPHTHPTALCICIAHILLRLRYLLIFIILYLFYIAIDAFDELIKISVRPVCFPIDEE